MASASSKVAPLEPTPLWRALELLVEQIRPRLVILDALADLYGGDEISRRQVRSFIVLLKRMAIKFKLAVLLIAHPSLSGMNTGSGLSGSTDWHNGPRARLYFEKPKDTDGKPLDADLRTLTVKKVQYAREGTIFRLRRKAGAFVYEGKDAGGASYDRAAACAKADRKFLDLLAELTAQGRDVSPTPSRSYAPAVFADHPDADGVTKKVLASAMERLLKAKRIAVETFGPPSKQRKRIIVLDPKTSEAESP